jgi:hypothetical protein
LDDQKHKEKKQVKAALCFTIHGLDGEMEEGDRTTALVDFSRQNAHWAGV